MTLGILMQSLLIALRFISDFVNVTNVKFLVFPLFDGRRVVYFFECVIQM